MFRSIRRICYAGLDSVPLREEAARRIASVIPFDAYHFATTDPDTGLFTHGVAAGIPASLNAAWLDHLYPFGVAEEVIDMAHSGRTVTTAPSDVMMDLLRTAGFRHDMRSVLAWQGDPWGFACLLREGSSAFREREVAFMRRLGPHLTKGLQTAALLERAPGNGVLSRASDGADVTPGVAVLDAHGRFQTRTGAAASYLEDLDDVGRGPDIVPLAVTSAMARLTHRHTAGAAHDGGPLSGELRVRGRSGRWYTIRALLAEPDATGSSATIVLIDPARPSEIALILTRLYGLTPREREILALAAKGHSTKQIARQLAISPYTVQEHLGNACAKVGVRTRKELLAKLFFDGFASSLTN